MSISLEILILRKRPSIISGNGQCIAEAIDGLASLPTKEELQFPAGARRLDTALSAATWSISTPLLAFFSFHFHFFFNSDLGKGPQQLTILTGACLVCGLSCSLCPGIKCCPEHGWWTLQQLSGRTFFQRQLCLSGMLHSPRSLAVPAACLCWDWSPTSLANLHHWLKWPAP